MTHPGLVVLFEDASMIALDKPAGLHSAPLRAGESETLLARVIERYPEVAALPGVKPVEPGLVHRLDRDTSGIVLVARTPPAFAALREQFNAGEARKEYRAICRGAAGVRYGNAPGDTEQVRAVRPGAAHGAGGASGDEGRPGEPGSIPDGLLHGGANRGTGGGAGLAFRRAAGRLPPPGPGRTFPISGFPSTAIRCTACRPRPERPAHVPACVRHFPPAPAHGGPMRLESPLPDEFRALMLASPGQIR